MRGWEEFAMMGTQTSPALLLYDFDLNRHVPSHHILREIGRFPDVEGMRKGLALQRWPVGATPSQPRHRSPSPYLTVNPTDLKLQSVAWTHVTGAYWTALYVVIHVCVATTEAPFLVNINGNDNRQGMGRDLGSAHIVGEC
jgi:hypothetical protein